MTNTLERPLFFLHVTKICLHMIKKLAIFFYIVRLDRSAFYLALISILKQTKGEEIIQEYLARRFVFDDGIERPRYHGIQDIMV